MTDFILSEDTTAAVQGTRLTPAQRFNSAWRDWLIHAILAGQDAAAVMGALEAAEFPAEYVRDKYEEWASHPAVRMARGMQARRRKVDALLDTLARLERQSGQGTVIAVERDLSAERFYRDYYYRNRPVLIEGIASHWRALTEWTPERLAERFGDQPVEVMMHRNSDPEYENNHKKHAETMTVKEFVTLVRSGGETNDYYLSAKNYFFSNPAFQEMFDDFDSLGGYFDPAAARGGTRFWFGPAGTVTELHHDDGPVMVVCVCGRKRVRLISPMHMADVYSSDDWISPVRLGALDYERFPRMREVDVMEVDVPPGSAVYLPIGWWHWVKALDVSVSVSLDNFTPPRVAMNWGKPR